MTMVMTRYEPNFVRSAMAPETIVVAVAQKTSWKKKLLQSKSVKFAPSQLKSSSPMNALPAPESRP